MATVQGTERMNAAIDRGGLRVAYLVNQYPKVSHSFIRREILALERQGVAVERFAVRGGGEDFPDPAEELYSFLEERGVELEEDEVEDVPLEGGAELALCEYVSEDEEEGESLYWMVGVGTVPGILVFATYFCTAGQEDAEREAVRAALASLRIEAA